MPCPKCAQDDARCHPSFQLQDGYVAPRFRGQGLDHLHQPCHRSRRRAKQMPCPKCAQDDARCHPSFHLQDGYVAPRFPGQGLDHFHHLSHQSRSRRTARWMPWQWPGPTTGRLGWNGAAAWLTVTAWWLIEAFSELEQTSWNFHDGSHMATNSKKLQSLCPSQTTCVTKPQLIGEARGSPYEFKSWCHSHLGLVGQLSSHVKHQNPWWTRHTNKIWRDRLRFATNDFATNPLAVVSGPTVFWTSDQHRTQSDPFLRWPDVSEGFVQLLRTVAWNVLGQNVPTKGTTNLTVVDGNLQAIRFQRQILLTHWTFKPNGRTLCSTTSYRHLLSVELSAMLSSRGANPD